MAARRIMEGPLNYLGSLYRAVPIGITVEGANIVTRSLIQFGQGAIRSHPYLLKEMTGAGGRRPRPRARRIRPARSGVMSATASPTRCRAWVRAWTGGLFAPAPRAGAARRFYRQLGRYASAFALAVDMALLTLGGALKRQEMISARFGDILSELYLLVRRAQALAGRRPPRSAICRCSNGAWKRASPPSRRASTRSSPISRIGRLAWLLRFMVLPLGPRRRGPSDRADAGLRGDSAGAVGDARPPDRRHLPRHGDDGPGAPRARVRSDRRDRSRCAIACARRTSATSPRRARRADQRGRGGCSSKPPPRRWPPSWRSTTLRQRNCRLADASAGRSAIASDVADRRRRGVDGRPVYIIDGSRTPFIKARGQAGPVHAGRPCRAMRAAAAAAPAVRARRVRPGHPRLRQRHRRRDEPGARRGAAPRHGRGDDRLHRADQLRLRHAVDRHRLSVHPRRPTPI